MNRHSPEGGGAISGVSIDKGKVAVLAYMPNMVDQSTTNAPSGDIVYVYETLTPAFSEVSQWRGYGHSYGEKIFTIRGENPRLAPMDRYNEIFFPHENSHIRVLKL